jgi:glycosyltransferase involved in cell wall biosynthesis
MPSQVLALLKLDEGYSSEEASTYDLSWQAVHKGYVQPTKTFRQFERVPVSDEYRFLRKYFHPVWSYYVLILRLFSFKNPLTEIKGCYRARKTRRTDLSASPITHKSWAHTPITDQPLVSVVIPTLNRYEYLEQVLKDFEAQTYNNFEVLVVDQSSPFNPAFYEGFDLDICCIRQDEPALWLARNTAISRSKGTLIALSEDDVRVPANWLENHLKALKFFNADVSAGVFFPEGASIPKERSFFAQASQFATGNALLKKQLFKKVGLFDRQFEGQRMGDGEFGLRLFIKGYRSISNPHAYCVDVKAPSGGLRQMGSWDAFRPKNWLAPRPLPSVLYFYRSYFGVKRSILALLKSVPPSVIPYRFKRDRKWLLFGIFISVFLFPLVLLQVLISWRRATQKLNQGPLISELPKDPDHHV